MTMHCLKTGREWPCATKQIDQHPGEVAAITYTSDTEAVVEFRRKA